MRTSHFFSWAIFPKVLGHPSDLLQNISSVVWMISTKMLKNTVGLSAVADWIPAALYWILIAVSPWCSLNSNGLTFLKPIVELFRCHGRVILIRSKKNGILSWCSLSVISRGHHQNHLQCLLSSTLPLPRSSDRRGNPNSIRLPLDYRQSGRMDPVATWKVRRSCSHPSRWTLLCWSIGLARYLHDPPLPPKAKNNDTRYRHERTRYEYM